MRTALIVVCWLWASLTSHGQYAPQVGLSGSTGISASSSAFTGWATHCAVQRGFMNIADPSLGYASAGDSSLACGPADVNIVSLGDSGVAVLTFEHPIVNGAGPDLAVFENGFLSPANDSQAFLELGFVEVSSDGVNYFRFPATSLTQTDSQITNDDYINAEGLNNLAGKYIALYGTPFDLEELAGIPGLDINNVTHVRIVDVIGAISGHTTRDSADRVVNDPYPTPYATCGFDLDAVGVINQSGTAVPQLSNGAGVRVYPNPVSDKLVVTAKGGVTAMNATLTDIEGNVLQTGVLNSGSSGMYMAQYPAGMYLLTMQDANGMKWVEKIIKR